MLYEVAIVKSPTKRQEEDGMEEELLLEPTAIIAKDPQGAAIAAALKSGLQSLSPNLKVSENVKRIKGRGDVERRV